MSTLYHRVALLSPAVGEIGVGWANRKDGLGFLVVDRQAGQQFYFDPKYVVTLLVLFLYLAYLRLARTTAWRKHLFMSSISSQARR